MITDEKRREVAKKLREQAENSYYTLMQWWDHLQLTVMGKVYLTAPEKVYLAIADLIDRPTCKIILESKLHTAYGEPINGLNAYVLSCGHQTVGPEKPGYCPKCGLVVTDD